MYKLSHGVVLMALLGGLTTHAEEQSVTPPTKNQDWPCTAPSQAPMPSASQQDFDRYSWQVFVALNRSASVAHRGQPDCDQTIGAKGPQVWQTYKSIDQIFLPDATNPGNWKSGANDTSLNKINVSVLKNPGVVNLIERAAGGWLIDQRGNPTYYATHVNQVAYEYIVNNHFYNADNVSQAKEIKFPDGATTVKASWRLMTKEDDASRYLTTQAQVDIFDEKGQSTGKTKSATLGLTGLHIATKASGYPQWLWSTFEHVDNVPPKEHVDGKWVDKPIEGVFYSYFNDQASAMDSNHAACLWQQQDNQLVCAPKEGFTITTPDPLHRIVPIPADTQKINADAQQNLAQTVFRHYQLIGTQRSSVPNDPNDPLGQPLPNVLANVTMESYIQPSSSCMSCHGMATPANNLNTSDFSFLFKFAQQPATAEKKK